MIFLMIIGFLGVSFLTWVSWGCYDEGYKSLALFAGICAILILFTSYMGLYEEGKNDILSSKICPVCYEVYSQTNSFCLEDGAELKFIVPEEKREK